ncbi:MAG: SusC/RagA family TonB-linked outer membrane protein [Balneola sp.]|nr:MAG: SusC/RagA family TonB-linked outer membrane protein [Balneola sp.]
MTKKLHLLAILAISVLSGTAFAQTGSISGVVEDSDQEPLAGASIYIVELDRGTTSNSEGQYSLNNVPVGTYTIITRFLGFKENEQTVDISSGLNLLDITLEDDIVGFDEVIVTGTGSAVSKKKLAMDVSSVDEQSIQKVPAYTLSSSLSGKIAGSTITPNGAPGAPSAIILRGINTMGTSRPMILIDGVEIDASSTAAGSGSDQYSRLSDIDFSNVERIEVVKGAAAATLYGAQGANGVIQIFTKSGTNGQTRIDASTTWSFDQLDESRTVSKATNFHAYPTDANGNIIGLAFNENTGIWTVPATEANSTTDQPYTGYDDGTGNIVPLTIYDDYLGEFYQTGISQNHQISISGGNEVTTYLVSGSFLGQEGIEQDINFERMSFRLNTTTRLRDDLTMSLRTNLVNSDRSGVSESGDNIESGLNNLLGTAPFIDPLWQDENGFFATKFTSGSVSTNGLFFKQIQELNTGSKRFLGNLNLKYNPTRFLEIDYKFGLDGYYNEFNRIQDNVTLFEDPTTGDNEVVILNPDGFSQRIGRTNYFYNSIVDVLLKSDLDRDFSLGIPVQSTTLMKFDWRRNDFTSTTAQSDGLPAGLPLTTIRAGATDISDEFQSTFITYGYLLNQRFDIDDYAGFSGGFRADKSSAFGEAAELRYFPRGDAYLRLSGFDFWDNMSPFVPEFKLRVAYGEAGTQPGAFDRFITLNQGNIGVSGTFNTPGTSSNPAIVEEESAELEFGADLSFDLGDTWFQAIGISATYWNRENSGVIQSLAVAPSTGSQAVLDNTIDLEATGFDLSLNSLVYNSQNFNWLANLNFGTSESTVANISNGEDLILSVSNNFDFIFREGERYGVFFGFHPLESLDEIDPTTNARYIAEADEGNFVIVDGAVVNRFSKRIQMRSEREVIGDPTPDFSLSFRNDFTIRRNLEVVFQVDWVQGFDILNGTKWWMFNAGTHEEFEDRVLIDGDEVVGQPIFDLNGDPLTQIARVDGSEPQAWRNYHASKRNGLTSYFIEDGSFVKLREVSVSYDLTSMVAQHGIKNLRLGVTGRNLLTLTGYEGFDPEVSQANEDSRFRGVDLFTYPNYRTFSFNVSLGL